MCENKAFCNACKPPTPSRTFFWLLALLGSIPRPEQLVKLKVIKLNAPPRSLDENINRFILACLFHSFVLFHFGFPSLAFTSKFRSSYSNCISDPPPTPSPPSTLAVIDKLSSSSCRLILPRSAVVTVCLTPPRLSNPKMFAKLYEIDEHTQIASHN
jgi:hypothetical protein